MIELSYQSDNDQFISTDDAEIYFLDQERIPNCIKCNILVSYHEKENKSVLFACHGNILRFHIEDTLVTRVEEL